ncbi:hypothetical protein H5410_051203 [Solanum commersonii]|uniref:Uncharacterized protein n=1 Tax=Solanum commersonii TaxID=4109 RepID=A0A9J5X091_SOLCO|nr:hypothetical protein H5410_051203 [Solanum commersonii]
MVAIIVITFSMRYALTFLKEFTMILTLCTYSHFFLPSIALWHLKVENEFCCVIACSGDLNSKQSFLYYNFDLDEVLHVQCAVNKETDSYDTKFLLAFEREDHC